MLADLTRKLREVGDRVHQRVGQRDLLERRRAELEQTVAAYQEDVATTVEARKLLEMVVRISDQNIRQYIEPLVTEALDFVFEQGLKFHLYSVSRRNQVEYDFVITRDASTETKYQKYMAKPDKFAEKLEQLVKETRNINYMYGGAVNQVLSLVLRFVLVELLKVRGPIFLDEPSSAVGEQYTARLGQLISSLSQRFGRQIILITHSKTLASFAEISYLIEKINGVSQARQSDG